MPVFIDFNKCDNAPECGGIEKCPTKAIYWDKGIKVDNSKCTNCGLCVDECPVGAIHVAKDDEELAQLQEQFKKEESKVSSLFVERYGATPVEESSVLKEDLVDGFVIGKNIMIELFEDETIQCLFGSIPSKELMQNFEYKKVEVKDKSKFDVSVFPALLIFEKGILKGKVEGYFSREQKQEMLDLISDILR